MAEGDLRVLNVPGGTVGVIETDTPGVNALLSVDANDLGGRDIRALNLPGGTLGVAETDHTGYYGIVTMSLDNAEGRTWRVLNVSNTTVTVVDTDTAGVRALLIVDTADADPADYRVLNVSGTTITLVETGIPGYRAMLTVSMDSYTDEAVRVLNVPGGTAAAVATETPGAFALLGEAWSAGGSVPTNTAPPSINSTATINTANVGTVGTWTGTPVLAHQWQRFTGGVWANIGGATATSYTPTDADFGYKLRLAETDAVSGVTVYSNETAPTLEAPVQTLDAESVINGGFDSDTIWTKGVGATITGGEGVMTNVGSAVAAFTQNGIVQSNEYYETGLSITQFVSGAASVGWNGGIPGAIRSATGTFKELLRANANNVIVFSRSASATLNVDDISARKINRNGELVAPTANMRITQLFTLPVSPVQGTQLWLLPRVADFANGNYWLALLEYTGTQWNATLYSVSSHARTSRASASNIGATNGIRVNANGSSLILETTANGGGAWTQRGITVSNSSHNTATGVNVMATSDFTLGALRYEDAV